MAKNQKVCQREEIKEVQIREGGRERQHEVDDEKARTMKGRR